MAGKNLHEWVRGEIGDWVREGLITAGQGEVLQERYPVEGARVAWGPIIFSSLGAVVVGLGVILLLAYNWGAIPKAGKLGIVFAAIVSAHGVGLRLCLGAPRHRAVGKAICLLGTMLFGAGIFLIAQIYHIAEHFPNAFVIWAAGALFLGLALSSIPQAVLAAVLFAIWSGVERVEFDSPMWLAPLVVIGVLVPQAYFKRSRVLLAVVIPAAFVTYAFALPAGYCSPWLTFSVLLSLAAVLIAKSFLVRRFGGFPQAGAVLGAYGWGTFFVMLFLLSFPGLSHTFFDWRRNELGWQHYLYWVLPLVACLSSWVLLAREELAGGIARERDDAGAERYLVPLTVVLALCDVFYLHHVGGWMVAGPFNLVFIGLTAALMMQGCRDGLLRSTVFGSILLVAVVVARYFDLFESLLVRGLVFVGLGLLLLTEGVLYSRAKRRRSEGGVQ